MDYSIMLFQTPGFIRYRNGQGISKKKKKLPRPTFPFSHHVHRKLGPVNFRGHVIEMNI
jgi:hypothetical protein